MRNTLNQATSWLATAARAGHARRPSRVTEQNVPLVLYEFEACPMCRRVREALTDLDLEVEVRPCPRNGTRFRPQGAERSGREQFPFLVDPNHDVEMLESGDIVAYLYETYGDGEVPGWLTGPGFVLSSQVASLVRVGAGFAARPNRAPSRALEMRGNESDPDARRVREVLCELEIAYVRAPGALQLRDPSSDTTLEDADEIIEWLEAEFAN